tara:strand:- start:847 stop:2208 length:1362 start_codon:yes stop_codon:yes gene_type:complete
MSKKYSKKKGKKYSNKKKKSLKRKQIQLISYLNNGYMSNSTNNNIENNVRINMKSNTKKQEKIKKDKGRSNFNVLRQKIQKSSNINNTMFRFGKPTQLINDFLYSLYNENIIRVEEGTDDIKTMMMTSVVELIDEKNTIYITISEEPNTDKKFYKKLGSILHMIENILFENNRVNNKLRIDNLDETNNCIYGNNRIEILDIDEKDIKKILKQASYNKNYREYGRNKYSYLKEIFNTENNKQETASSIRKYRNLTNNNTKVKFIFNNKYINERRGRNFPSPGTNKSYKPFFKGDKNKPDMLACNSGSICSESKIFSYLHDNNLYKQIKGAIAYWIGISSNFGEDCKKKVSNCNYHPNYAYEESDELDTNMDNMIHILDTEHKFSIGLKRKQKNNKWKNMFRGFALPCPGCFLNKDSYKNNTREEWETHQCLEYNEDSFSRYQFGKAEDRSITLT